MKGDNHDAGPFQGTQVSLDIHAASQSGFSLSVY